MYCPGIGRGTGDAADGRAYQRPGSCLYGGKIEKLAMELKKNYTIIIVTHNMQQASRISRRTAFLHLGELVEFGGTGQVFSVPRDKRTEDYVTGRFG